MIPHSRPSIAEKDIQGVINVLQSGNLVQGEQVVHFEEELASFVGVHSAVAVSSGTAALHLALLTLDIKSGDEVIIPSFVCTALLNAVRYVDAKPVLADIDEYHFNMDAEDVRRRLTPRTRAIIVPHLFGQAADLDKLITLGVPIIEDCAQSLGSLYRGKMTGSFGILSVFSFYATKLMATGEGGMVASDNPALVERIRDLRDYDEKDDDRLRYNYKMTDIQATLGRTQLRQLPGFLEKRRAIAGRYDRKLQEMGLEIPRQQGDRTHIYFRYVIRHNQSESIIRALNALDIACRRPIHKPLHHHLGFNDLPITENIWREALSIPIYPALNEAEISKIVSSLNTLCKKGS